LCVARLLTGEGVEGGGRRVEKKTVRKTGSREGGGGGVLVGVGYEFALTERR